MKRIVLYLVFALFITNVVCAQTYQQTSHFSGIFADQPADARATGMGYTMVTLNGVANSVYNPASISPDSSRLDVQFNYTKGHAWRPTAHYPFIGISYKVLPKLTVAGTLFSHREVDPVWTTQVGGKNFDPDGLITQTMYSIVGAYQVLDDLHVGVSGNFLKEQGVRGVTTVQDFILSVGSIYERDINLITKENILDQKIRIAGSLMNALGNSITEQKLEDRLNYRVIPVYLKLGASYRFTVPIEAAFTDDKAFFETNPRQLDLSFHIHFQDHLKTKEISDKGFINYEYGSAFGIGTEVVFLKTLSFRLGYFSEKRYKDDELSSGTAPKKAGLTWGYGANIPVKRLTDNKVPFDVEVNFVTSKLMNELNPQISHHPVFSDDQFLFAVGINIKMR